MVLNCYLIEPAQNFLDLLSRPMSVFFLTDEKKKNLYTKWKYSFIELYNSRSEFICMANTDVDRYNTDEKNILKQDINKNYDIVRSNFNFFSNSLNLWSNQHSLNDDHFILNMNDILLENNDNGELIADMLEKENESRYIIQLNMFRFMVMIFQYLNVFDERNVSINLWNYCLRSSTFSLKCFFIGIFTLVCQYLCAIALVYDVLDDYSMTKNFTIIMISILSSILASLYSYNTIGSYLYSRQLYKFIVRVYDDYPEMSLSKNEREMTFYRNRKITMKRWHIIYNWWADFFSNFILPLCIPIINFFIILGSESIIDAILNSVAVFFIVQIDEDLYSYSDFDKDKNTLNFSRWLVSVIYCNHFPLFKDVFQLECQRWYTKLFKLTNKFKKKPNKIAAANIEFNLPPVRKNNPNRKNNLNL